MTDYADLLRGLREYQQHILPPVLRDAADAIEALLAERDRLREELESVLADWNALVAAIGSPTNGGAIGFVTSLRSECDRLREELAASKQDAARYRWMRDEFRSSNWHAMFFLLRGPKFDAAVDAAMGGGDDQTRAVFETKAEAEACHDALDDGAVETLYTADALAQVRREGLEEAILACEQYGAGRIWTAESAGVVIATQHGIADAIRTLLDTP